MKQTRRTLLAAAGACAAAMLFNAPVLAQGQPIKIGSTDRKSTRLNSSHT